jgi:chromosome segregation ATPase
VQKERATLLDQIELLKSNLAQKQEEIARIQARSKEGASAAKDQLDRLSSRLERVQADEDRLSTTLAEKDATIVKLQQQSKSLSEQMSRMTKQQDFDAIREQLAKVERDLRASERSRNKMAEELEYSRDLIRQLEAKISEIEPLRERAAFLSKDLA